MDLCNLCLLSIGAFLLHNYWYHGHLDDYMDRRRRRKHEKGNWRKRAIKMNLPQNASMARICQAEEHERQKRIEAHSRERERKYREKRRAAARKAAATRKKNWRNKEFEQKIGHRFIANQIAALDKQYGGIGHAPPEVVNQMLSQFTYADEQYPKLSEEEVELRLKKQMELDELVQDDFLNRLKWM